MGEVGLSQAGHIDIFQTAAEEQAFGAAKARKCDQQSGKNAYDYPFHCKTN